MFLEKKKSVAGPYRPVGSAENRKNSKIAFFAQDEYKIVVEEPLIVDILYHTQHVESLICVITQNGKSAASAEKREGMAIATMRDRKSRPWCETKADFQ
jgi:hypothetical protein